MFSESTLSIIKSIQEFSKNRKGVMRVYFSDKTFKDFSAKQIAEMPFEGFVNIAIKLDSGNAPTPPLFISDSF